MDINVYFLDSEESDPDANAYQYVKEHIREENIHIVSYSQGFKMIENDKFVKQDVFVLEKFEGSFFEHLQKTKALVVGPRCLIKCLINCEQIPLGKSPVFTTAMRDLHISATGFTGDEKEKMRNLISWMGGYYYSNFGRNVTHLVANTIKSTKYEHAAVNGIPIMHPDWVEAVWQKSKTEDTEAKNEEYNKYRLPIFYNLNITCSGLTNERKEQVMQLINENGGIFNRAFRSQITDVVLIEKDKTNSDKYKAAISYKKDVLLPEWIIDSVEAGYALPTKKYIVKSVKVSTPTKNDHTISDMTQLSGISMISTGNHNYDQTVNDSLCSMANMTVTTAQPVRNILAEVMSSDYKKAGLFLDGCSVYISGFKNDEKEKLNRILNTSGATRFDEMEDDNLTHIIVAPNTCDKKIVALGKSKDIHVVTLNWLLESIKQKQPAKESNYQVEIPTEEGTTDCPSPSSKKTLKSMNHSFSFKQPDLPKKKLNFEAPKEKIINQFPDDNDENDLLQQYQNSPSLELPPIPTKQISNPIIPVSDNTEQSLQMDSCATVNTLDYENLTFLEGMSVFIVKSQFDEEFYTQIIFECESAKGKVVSASYKDVVDYVLVSFEKASDFENLPIRAKNIVNELWIESSMKENIQVPIQYFHHPIPVTVESKPLSGMTIVISTYTDIERDFVDSLANLLGAQCKKLFAKKEMPLLICPLPEGNKYEGALKWKFPVVTSKYLVDCAKYGEKLPYDEYLVGDSVSDFPNSSKSTPKVTPKTPVANFKTPVANSKTPNIEPMESTVELHTADFTNLTPTTTNEFTPLRNKRVSELAGPKRKSLPSESPMGSPHTPASGSYKCYDAFEDIEDFLADITDENERNCLRECILEMKENQTPEIERIKRMACTPVNRRLSIPKETSTTLQNKENTKYFLEIY
ncbi:TOPBP1 family protein [Megaselia abdita]